MGLGLTSEFTRIFETQWERIQGIKSHLVSVADLGTQEAVGAVLIATTQHIIVNFLNHGCFCRITHPFDFCFKQQKTIVSLFIVD